MKPVYFATPQELRRWFEQHHTSAEDVWVGFYKKATGRPSITWAEAVDEALCFGWIDGIRKSVDAERYTNRFTPRRPRSNWSAVNTRRVSALIAAGRMRPSGLAAFEKRDAKRSAAYSFERSAPRLSSAQERRFRANRAAWAFFSTQPPGYRKTALWWVMSARQESTRDRRLDTLIADSATGQRIAPLRRPERTSDAKRPADPRAKRVPARKQPSKRPANQAANDQANDQATNDRPQRPTTTGPTTTRPTARAPMTTGPTTTRSGTTRRQ